MWQNTGETSPGCILERSNSSPENQHAFFFSHCLYFLSCTGQNCSDIITEAIQRHTARIEKADTPTPALQARRFSARFAVSYVCFAYSELFRTPPSVSQQRQRKGKATSSALLYHAAEKSARRSAQPQKSKNPAPRLSAGKTVNSDLSVKPSENAVFSRHFAYLVFQPYVFSLVFALTSRNKGKFFTLRRPPYPAVLRKYASLPL